MEIPLRILIVDDNETNILSLKGILRSMSLAIDSANSGFEALDLAAKIGYSLVLLDIQMPLMDGFETMANLRKIPRHQFTPIILISAVFTEDQYKIKGISTGAVDFIPKPVHPDILRAKVGVFLDLERNRAKLVALIEELKVSNKQLNDEIEKSSLIARDLEDARSKAEKASEYKSRLLVNMSHEIRTPVNSILGFADLITNPDVSTADKERYMRYVSSSSQNLMFLIDEILEHSRLEAGELKINLAPVNVCDLCSELLASFEQIRQMYGKDNIVLRMDTDPAAPELMIRTDIQRLRQILSNLISNAFKYTQSGLVTFGFTKKESETEFFVKDSGIGLTAGDIKEIFNRFKRVENRTEDTATGTGLGLSISKTLIELLGGRIWVESEPGKGSIFRFSLPLLNYEAAENDRIRPINEDFMPDLQWRSKTILIAEDEELNFQFLKESLRATGINILWAKTGVESVELVKNNPSLDMVLMDVRMPDMDGWKATRLIKSMRPEIPLIIQTACALSDEKNRSVLEGGDEFITKPINRLLLLKTMSLYLGS